MILHYLQWLNYPNWCKILSIKKHQLSNVKHESVYFASPILQNPVNADHYTDPIRISS